MKVLLVGDIVGEPGRRAFTDIVARLRAEGRCDLAIVNAENAAGGRGLTRPLAEELFEAGADVITMGDHVWDQKELRTYLEQESRIVRPYNMPPGCPGKGYTTINSDFGPISVVNLVGRVFMGSNPNDCPFRAADQLLNSGMLPEGPIFVDFHAEATSEKIVLGRYLDGRVTCFTGTHTHVQTSDECILPAGTAYITDLGMTGAKDSAIGRDLKSITQMFLTGMPSPFKVATDDVHLEGLIVEVKRQARLATAVERIRLKLENRDE